MQFSKSAKITQVSNLITLVVVGVAWGYNWPQELALSYGLHKFLHITGVVLFFGNLIVGPLWVLFAWFLEGGRHLRFATQVLSNADICFTVPGIQLTLWNGIYLAASMGGIKSHGWLVEAMVLLIVTSLFSAFLVLPWQERLVASTMGTDFALMKRYLVRWSIWGTAVLVPITLVAWLMVVKQPLILGP
ncbi:MAG: DUF2269 family protein [Myxococcota bacterium]|nr:DUF2269 family protein [Myxococcota bacterium]